MKYVLFLLISLSLYLPVAAQTQNNLDYGDMVEGQISNQAFEIVYTFEGQKDEVVVITMTSAQDSGLDPYLYLTTTDNTVISQNDDAFNLNARIIMRLPESSTYNIIATRLGGRTGEGEGQFSLSLEDVPSTEGDIIIDGAASPTEQPPTHIFILDADGVYTITYSLSEGDYFPSLVLERVNNDEFYNDEIASLGADGLQTATIALNLNAGELYVLSIQDNFYVETATTTSYTITIAAQGE